ncbi:MAG: thioredoxin family protein, partial [Bacteroidales bacterium]|nr:thioredoxin family protein [Bacteroidales bacterium]
GATYNVGGNTPEAVFGFTPKYSNVIKQPEGFNALFEYNEAMEYARKVGKPVFLDFTGAGCVNCREMEARVFSDPRVHAMMAENFVILQLYGDDKTVLPENEWIVSNQGKTLKSIGKINTYLMNRDYNVNAQPYYVLIDPKDGKTLATRAYDLDIEGFIEFLKKGVVSVEK